MDHPDRVQEESNWVLDSSSYSQALALLFLLTSSPSFLTPS